MKKLALLLLVAALVCGCFFRPTEVVKHPDAPMLILEAKRGFLRVAVYDTEGNRLIQLGWVRADDARLKGWSVMKYDWDAYIARHGGSQ